MSDLTRRQALVRSGAFTLSVLLVGCGEDGSGPSASAGGTTPAASQCVLTPEQTEGPYYLDGAMLRRDITEGRPGTPLELRLKVQDASSCEPIEGATVELWHTDAVGTYSGVEGDDGMFMRGGQRSAADGVATFDTVYPGWYQGRAPHIHVKVFAEGGTEVHTGQLYFDEATSATVYEGEAYSDRGQADTTNGSDGIYGEGGAESTLALKRSGDGYVGSLTLGIRNS